MSQRLLSITVRGRERTYSFTFTGDPAHLEEWRADGLDVCEVVNIIPAWVADAGLAQPWCAVQDFLNFKWLPWRRRRIR